MTTDKEEIRDLNFYKNNAMDDFVSTPISVLRYITELESKLEAKDKEIDFQKRGFDFLYGQAKQEITDLKAEIERLHKSISRI